MKTIEGYWDIYVQEMVLPCCRQIADVFGEPIAWFIFAGGVAAPPAGCIGGLVLILQGFGALPAQF